MCIRDSRKGEYIGDVLTKDADQQSLTDMMVGHSVSLNINRPTPVSYTHLDVYKRQFQYLPARRPRQVAQMVLGLLVLMQRGLCVYE